MIGAPHPLHTHSRSILHLYNVFQHLLLWLGVIRMQPQPDSILTVLLTVVGDSVDF